MHNWFSLLPAWRVSSSPPAGALQTSVGNIGGRREGKWSIVLLTGQVSLSLLLLSMAALFAQTLLNLDTFDAGLDRQHVLSVHLDLDSGSLRKQDMTELNQRILDRDRKSVV